MSRTKKGKKRPGYEYWGKRLSKMTTPGVDTKRHTHRLERLDGKKQIKGQLDEE